jgi:hypothetical protein
MAFAVLDLISNMIFSLLGNPLLVLSFLTFVILLFLLAAKVSNPAVVLGILAPMWIMFIVNEKGNNFILVPPWLAFPILMTIGALFALALWKIFTEGS